MLNNKKHSLNPLLSFWNRRDPYDTLTKLLGNVSWLSAAKIRTILSYCFHFLRKKWFLPKKFTTWKSAKFWMFILFIVHCSICWFPDRTANLFNNIYYIFYIYIINNIPPYRVPRSVPRVMNDERWTKWTTMRKMLTKTKHFKKCFVFVNISY